MHIPTLLLTTLTTLSPLLPTVHASKTTLATQSFGIDPLQVQSSGGNQVIASILNDPTNAHTGSGYLSLSFPDTSDKRYVVFVAGFHMKAHTNYTASYWARSGAEGCYGMVGVRDNEELVVGETENVLLTERYRKFEQVVTGVKVPKGDLGVAFFSVTCTTNGTAEVFVDDFLLTSEA